MLEFVLAFPLVLLLILGAIQVSHMWVARLVVQYAAYSAARAALVCSEQDNEYSRFTDGSAKGPERAAERVCAWVVMGEKPTEPDTTVPGWGDVPGSGAVGRKTTVEVRSYSAPGDSGGQTWNVEATVKLKFDLIVPLAGPLIGWSVNPFPWYDPAMEVGSPPPKDIDIVAGEVMYPQLELKETVALSKPYVTVTRTNW